MSNQQPIVKRNIREDGKLEVFSVFGPTFQGEGPFAGTPCVFVRLAECNLQCPGCDTIYSGPDKLGLMRARDVYLEVAKRTDLIFGAHRPLVVISGGEPFRQNLLPLLELLIDQHFVQIETNGTLPAPTSSDAGWRIFNDRIDERKGVYIVCSPKTGIVHQTIDEAACAYKYVMSWDSVDADGLPNQVLDHTVSPKGVARPPVGMPVYLQPMDHGISATNAEWDTESPNAKSLEAVKASCLEHGYILCLQLHKIIGVE